MGTNTGGRLENEFPQRDFRIGRQWSVLYCHEIKTLDDTTVPVASANVRLRDLADQKAFKPVSIETRSIQKYTRDPQSAEVVVLDDGAYAGTA
jgi:hypothetical protein